jgi:type IV pilus assembly protein PilA
MLARIRKSVDDKDQGFTLIELLVVMIIIGILAAIAIPVFLNQRQKAVESSMKSDLRTLANQEETYFTDNQYYLAAAQVARVVTFGGVATDTVTVSAGNKIVIEGLTTAIAPKGGTGTATVNAMTVFGTAATAATGYCTTVTNTGTPTTWYYNSLSGGLTTTACP